MTTVQASTPNQFHGIWPEPSVTSPIVPGDWDAARDLIQQLVGWIATETNIALSDIQADMRSELADLPARYSWPAGRLFIGRLGGRSVGTTGIKRLSPDTAEVKRVWISPEGRGHGLASRMLDAALHEARLMRMERVVLETHPAIMPTAVAMYRKYGFQEIPAYTDLPDRVPGAIAMGLRLP